MSNLFSGFKSSLYKKYGENPGKMLVHTGVLGWILSSLAQVSAVVFNDKISPEQKSFLIPQEIADAGINILSFYLITSSFKNFASKIVSTGKLSTQNIKQSLLKQGIDKSKIGNLNFDIGELPTVPEEYKPFKNGVDVIASTIGSIISCNLVTPVLRNKYASQKQKQAIAKMHKSDANLVAPKGITMAQYQNLASMKYSSSLKI
jgi:hypothetical protein